MRQQTPDEILARINNLGSDEKEIMLMLLERLETGREVYGEWKVSDGRNYEREMLEELLDAMHYGSAMLLKLRKGLP